jgi:hypothetical protein
LRHLGGKEEIRCAPYCDRAQACIPQIASHRGKDLLFVPLIYAIAMSYLVAITVALPISAIFKMYRGMFSLAPWEKEGEVYDRTGIRAFRWVLLHSPLGWINSSLHLGAGRTDCERLLREMKVSEGVHWLSCFLTSILAISYLVGGYAVYGYVMLLIRVPFDVYPIMLHRRNRGRVCRVLSRQLRTSG